MLRKLLKHEFRATGRIMLPLYLVLLATSVGANLSTRGLLETDNRLLDILGGLLIIAFVVAIIGVCIMSLVVMVQRFYKNLLQDEGYIMMTLPCSIHQQVWSKLIVSAVWFALSFAMVCLACVLMAFDVSAIQEILDLCQELLHALTGKYSFNAVAFGVELLVLCFVGCCVLCLEFYAALAIGHSRPSHKMAWSVLFFFVLQFAMQMISSALIIGLDESAFYYFLMDLTDVHLSGTAAIHASLWFLSACAAIYGAIFYFLTTYFLKRHLNLE